MNQLRISIPEPCTQNWASMSPTEKGRYCNSCEKEVIDFRGWTTDELQHWFAKSNGGVCGRISQKQLDYFEPKVLQPSSWGFSSKVLLASALALFIGSKAYATTKASINIIVYEAKNLKKDETKARAQQADSLITISGVVKDGDDKLPIPGVFIAVKDKQLQTVTDKEGKFLLQFNALKGERLKLSARFIGYNNIEREITVGQKDQIEVFMSVDNASLMGYFMIIRPSFPKRVWNFIKRPFVKRH